MKELAEMIQHNPQDKDKLIDNYQARSLEERKFLNSLKPVAAHVVPSLILCFCIGYQNENKIQTIGDIMKDKSFHGSLFTDGAGALWQYLGVSTNGTPLCRDANTGVIHPMVEQIKINLLF